MPARWLGVVTLGLVVGVGAAWSDVAGSTLDPSAIDRVLLVFLNAAATWAALAVLAGWIIGTPMRAAAMAGPTGLLLAIAGYYAYGLIAGDRSDTGVAGVVVVVRVWVLAALIAGPVLGIAGALAHRPGWVGLVAALVVPAGIMVEQVVLRRFGPDEFAVDPVLAFAQGLLLVIGVAIALAAIVRFASGQRISPGRGSGPVSTA
jgi:hypothetical protein